MLADASFAFAEAAVDYRRLLETIVCRVVGGIGDTCLIRMLSEDGERLEAATLHDIDEGAGAAVQDAVGAELGVSALPFIARTLESGQPLLVPEVDAEWLAENVGAELWPNVARAPTSLIVAPVIARECSLGLLFVARRSGPPFDEADRDFVTELAARAAIVLANARLISDAAVRSRNLARSERRFATTLRSIGDAVVATDERGRVTFVNPVAERLSGWTHEEANGRRFDELFPTVDGATGEPLDSPVTRALAEGGPINLPEGAMLRARSGVTIPIDDSSAPINDDDGHPIGVVLVFRDATEVRRDGERRRLLTESTSVLLSSLEYEQTLSRVAELAVPEFADWCAVDLVSDRGAIQRVAITHSDPAKLELAQRYQERYPPDPNASMGVAKVVRTGEPELVSEIPASMFAAVGDEERRRMVESLGLRSYLIVPLVARGRILGALSCVTAESGRRYDQADLDFAEELGHRCAYAVDNARLFRQAQEAVAARDEFLSIASHELRTPLTPLQLQLEMLAGSLTSRRLDNGDNKKLDIARRQVERLSRLVESLLDVSRITTGRLRLDTEDAELVELVSEIVDRHREEADRAGCKLELTAHEEVRGRWDRARVDQIVTSLLSNAIKYSAAKPIEVTVSNRGEDDVEIGVVDRGFGIAQENVERIFRCFERAVSAQHYGGLGLGLYIARQLARAHGGDIVVESEIGSGATFRVMLPRRPRPMQGDSAAIAPRAPRPILVIDDDVDIRESVAELLSERGYSVQTAANGREALELVRDTGALPKVILLDMMMPVMDGWAFVTEVRKLPWLTDIPIVVFSAHGDAAQIARSLQVSGCIKKPFQLSELLDTVEEFQSAPG